LLELRHAVVPLYERVRTKYLHCLAASDCSNKAGVRGDSKIGPVCVGELRETIKHWR
jgi:hypothetical protein